MAPAPSIRPKDPPVSYNFSVTLAPGGLSSALFLGASMAAGLPSDAAFTSISGLGVEMEYETVRGGGYNNTVYHLPKGVKRAGLTLNRGLAPYSSPLMQWCLKTGSGYLFPLPMTLIVMLLDKNPKKPPVMTWFIFNAIPVKWQIDELDAKKSDIVIETIEVMFSNMNVIGSIG
jgi:phage tail-like protein